MALTSLASKVSLSCQRRGWLKRPMANPVDASALMNQAALFCRKAFEQNGAGKVTAAALGLHDENLFGRHRVGYADDALLATIPADGGVRDVLKDLGVILQDGSLAIAGCMVFPVLDRDGRATGIVAIDGDGRERRYPASLPLYGLNPANLGGRAVTFTDSALKALLYIQAGVLTVPLGEVPGEAEEAFLRLNRPQKAFVDAEGPGVAAVLQKLEIPCYRLKIEWPASQVQLEEAMTAAEPMEMRLSELASPMGGGALPIGGDAVATVTDDVIRFRCSGRDYELRDLDPGESGRMRVRLKAVRNGYFHLDTLDLYAARSRANFAKAASGLYASPQAVVEADLCLMIRKIEAMRAAERGGSRSEHCGYAMTADEEAEALELLKSPDLLDRIVCDMGRLGYIGEAANKRLGYLIAVSRKLSSPLCGAIMSRAGAGKSSLMDALADMTPPEDLVRFTRITPQALYYSDPKALRHKVVMSGEDEGLAGSDYVLRELISSKKIRLAVPVNDADSGKLRTMDYEVEGPIALLFSTTKPAMHFENATRLITVSLDESPEQTGAILELQRRRRTLDGLGEKPLLDDLRRLHQNAQRLLKPLLVVNPFAPHLDFPTQPLEMRREHEKYLSLIEAVALLHQHQRERKTAVVNGQQVEYVEVAVEDIEEANRLMTEILGTAREELTRPSRDLLGLIQRMVDERAKAQGIPAAQVRFNRRDVREYTGWSYNQVQAHIGRLEELEYLLVSRGERGRLYRYELATDAGKKRLPGLTDPAKLRALQGKIGFLGIVGGSWAGAASSDCADKSNISEGDSLKLGHFPDKEGVGCVRDAHV